VLLEGDVLKETFLLIFEPKNIGDTGDVDNACRMSRGSRESAVEMVPRDGGLIEKSLVDFLYWNKNNLVEFAGRGQYQQ